MKSTEPFTVDDVVVAIPARNEERRIAACLSSIASQTDPHARPIKSPRVVIFLNNCVDDTRQVAEAVALRSGLNAHFVERTLDHSKATAGWARRLAMDEAIGVAGQHGLILTTDADSRPQQQWLWRNLQHFNEGVDAVAGEIDWDPDDPAPRFSENRQLEAHYAVLAAELAALLDPLSHDPWPNHRWAWGASFAVTAEAYSRVGGIPTVELAEDRAFQDRLLYCDARIRHASDVRVWTSGRTEGRAPGGLADLIRAFAEDEEVLCDALLEPPYLTFRRARLRGRLRQAWTTNDFGKLRRYAPADIGDAATIFSRWKTFGAFWQAVEAGTSWLAPMRVHPRHLRPYIEQLRRLIARIRAKSVHAEHV